MFMARKLLLQPQLQFTSQVWGAGIHNITLPQGRYRIRLMSAGGGGGAAGIMDNYGHSRAGDGGIGAPGNMGEMTINVRGVGINVVRLLVGNGGNIGASGNGGAGGTPLWESRGGYGGGGGHATAVIVNEDLASIDAIATHTQWVNTINRCGGGAVYGGAGGGGGGGGGTWGDDSPGVPGGGGGGCYSLVGNNVQLSFATTLADIEINHVGGKGGDGSWFQGNNGGNGWIVEGATGQFGGNGGAGTWGAGIGGSGYGGGGGGGGRGHDLGASGGGGGPGSLVAGGGRGGGTPGGAGYSGNDGYNPYATDRRGTMPDGTRTEFGWGAGGAGGIGATTGAGTAPGVGGDGWVEITRII